MLTVQGGPTPPAGRTLAATTQLVVTYHTPYGDDSGVYATQHVAVLDGTSGGWKPDGEADGVDFELPGAPAGETGPLAVLEERQVFADGGERTSERQARIVETSAGVWAYGSD